MGLHGALSEPPSPPAVHAGDVVLPKRVENRGALVISMAELPSARVLGTPRFEKKPGATTGTPNDRDEGEIGEADNHENGELREIPNLPYRIAYQQQKGAQERHHEENAQEDGEPACEANQFRMDIQRWYLSLDAR
jgi:hypothetical protein